MLGGLAAVVVLLLVAAGAALAAFRYLPALDEARALRTDLETMVDRVREAGLGIDRATMDALDADLVSARGRFDRLHGLLADDPLVALARGLPPTAANVRGADQVVAAAGNLLDAVGDGLVIGRRFVEIREAQAADPASASALSELVELMATTRDSAVAAAASIATARQHLAAVPDGLVGQVESVRDAMTARIDTYGPLLDTYVDVSARLPSILGWDGPRRYLVLTQDPAELRPTRWVHRELRDHRVRPGTDHRAPLPGRRVAGLHVGTTHASSRRRSWRTTCSGRSSRGSSRTPTGRRTSRPAHRTRSAYTRTSPAIRRSTACSGSPRTRSTSC